jgi:iron complex outermembrane receptor protein
MARTRRGKFMKDRSGVMPAGAGRGRWLLASACALALLATASPAFAQQAATQGEPAEGGDQADTGGIAEIVVTARYVTESIQDTPMAITAQSGEQLEAANVTNVSTLGAVVPNLWTVPGDTQSAGTPKVRMRGVAQGDSSSIAVPPAIAIYHDDVYHGTTAGSDLDFTDVDRVEVNRGPQSTLSGNASIGGSVKIFTRDPRGDGSGYLTVVGGSRNKLGIGGAIDLALAETLAVRFSGNFERQDGFVDRLDFTCQMRANGTPELAGNFPLSQPDIVNKDDCAIGTLGGYNHFVGQVKLRYRPTDDLDIILSARKRIERDEETPEIALDYAVSTAGNVTAYTNAVQAAFGPGIALDDRFMAPASSGGYASYATNCRPALPIDPQPSNFCYDKNKSADHLQLSGKVLYDFSEDLHLTAIAAYTDYGNEFTQNGDQSPLGYVISHFENEDTQYTGEVRLDGTLFDDRLNWVFGGFLQRLTGYQKNFIGVLLTSQNSLVKGVVESQSGFFHLDYNLTDRWRVSGGARYAFGETEITINNPSFVNLSQTSELSRWDWLLSTDYQVTDDVLAFANVATGSRPPGLTTIVNTPRQLAPTPEEDLVSYEVGVKADLLGRRLRTNVSAFYMDYNSLSTAVRKYECLGQPSPATPFEDPSNCSVFAPNTGSLQWNINAGIPAEVKGFEWEITAMPVDGLRIDWSGGYNKFTSGITTPGQPGYLWPGNHRQPEWSMHANVSYDIETPLGTFTPRVDWNWQSQQDFDPQNSTRAPLPIYIIRPYSLWNAQIAFRTPDDDWSATLQVNNVADKFYYYQMFQGLLNTQTRVGNPREVTLTVRRNF